ncbi:hypothetical protein MBLNU457_4075t1 [Dothideomycetes sp. NU457]
MAPSLSQISNKSTGDGGTGLGIANGSSTGGTEMARGASGMGMLGVSPNMGMGLMAGFASPAALAGLDIGTPSLLEAAAGGGQPMGLSLSDLGVSTKRNEDDDRRNKLEGVLGRLLGKRKRTNGGYGTSGMGRVCDEGVRRVGRWAGFDVNVEAKYEGKEFEGERPITVAGTSAVLIDVSFKSNLPKSVEVTFSSEQEAVSAHQKDAADVLMQNLTPKPGMAAINTKLDQFAANLEALSRLDKLSTPQLNCVEAVTGVYTSLKRLYDHEKEVARSLFDSEIKNGDEKIGEQVMCKNSGRPGMHTHGRIGLNLDYWRGQNSPGTSTTSKIKTESDENAMNLDHGSTTSHESSPGIYSLELTVEPSDATTYPALRNSSSWISERIIKPQEESSDPADILSTKPIIDWLEPELTLIKAENDQDTMDVDGDTSSKPPAARFVARLHPPLVMPYTTAMQVLQSVGLTTMPPTSPESYESMLLSTPPPSLDGTQHPVTSTKKVLARSQAGEKDVSHKNTLYVPRPEYAFKLEEIPFSHPKQIVALLPTLRQWACIGSLLTSSFSQDTMSSRANGVASNAKSTTSTMTREHDYLSLFSAAPSPPQTDLAAKGDEEEINVDITLSTALPNPSLVIIFPLQEDATAANSTTAADEPGRDTRNIAFVNVEVFPDAEIMVSGQDVFDTQQRDLSMKDADPSTDGDGHGGAVAETQQQVRRLGRGLEVAGDVGVWIEWIRKRAGRAS